MYGDQSGEFVCDKGLGKKVSFKSHLPSKKIHKSWTSTQDFFRALI